MEAVAELEEKFARIEEVSAAEGEAVVEKKAAVGDVDGLKAGGEAFAEIFAERQVESGVRLKVVAWINGRGIAVGEAGGVVGVGGDVRVPGKIVMSPDVERVALVVVEEAEAGGRRVARSDKAAGKAAVTKSELVGVG